MRGCLLQSLGIHLGECLMLSSWKLGSILLLSLHTKVITLIATTIFPGPIGHQALLQCLLHNRWRTQGSKRKRSLRSQSWLSTGLGSEPRPYSSEVAHRTHANRTPSINPATWQGPSIIKSRSPCCIKCVCVWTMDGRITLWRPRGRNPSLASSRCLSSKLISVVQTESNW